MSTDVIKARIMTVMRNMPPLPEVTRQLMSMLDDGDPSAADVAKVLSLDQDLAGKMLRLVNSPFCSVPGEVTSLSGAVDNLGTAGIRNLALGFGAVEALQEMGGGVDMNDFWGHALANGAACQALVPFLNRRVDPEEAFIAGLMHDIGTYVLATAVPDIYQPILADRQADRLVREAEEIGLTHAQVGQGLLQFWKLPAAFADAARYHHDVTKATDGEQPLTNLVGLADVLACVNGGAFENGASEADLLGLMRGLEMDLEDIKAALQAMDRKIEEMESFMAIAGADSSRSGAGELTEATSCVVVTTEDERRAWSYTLLEHFGHEIFPMDDYFNQIPGSEKVGLVLIDTQCLTQQKIVQLMPFLAGQPVAAAVLLERGAHPPAGTEDLPRLGLVFSRGDVQNILTGQPV